MLGFMLTDPHACVRVRVCEYDSLNTLESS